MPENITALCPECQTRYTLKSELAGKRMQCRESSCGILFVIAPLEASVAVTQPKPQPVPAAESALDWQDGPPPVRDDAERNWTEPPPVRTANGSALPTYLIPKKEPNRRNRWILALVAFVIVMVAWGGITIIRNIAQAEERLAAEADKAYANGKFGDAGQKYKTLIDKYARGLRANEYKFLRALADTRRIANIAPPEPDSAYEALMSFVSEHGNSAYLSSRRKDVFETSTKVLADVVRDGGDALGSPKPELAVVDARLQQAKQLAALAQRIAPPDADVAAAQNKLDEFTKSLESVRGTLAARAEILQLLNQPRPDLEAARNAIRRSNLSNDNEIQAAWRRAEETLRKSITYQVVNQAAQSQLPAATLGGIIPDSRGSPGNGPRVPALANGLLYALEGRSGRLAWLDRVGIDARILPLRLPASGDDEPWLVYSTEPLGLSARKSSNGSVIWFQPLDRPIIGPPVTFGRRIFVAQAHDTGRVLDIDATTGQLNGYFETGQALAGGVALAPGSARIYAPALGHQVLVLDFAGDDVGMPPRCIATLNTGHAPGSLLGPPKVIAGPDGHPTLLLMVADGVGNSSMWLVRLGDPNASTVSMDRVPANGWSWFLPEADAERLAWITDRGVLNLAGLRRPGALDPPVYPLLDTEVRTNTPTGPMQRALIAHADESGLVVLSGGKLRQWQLGIDRVAGRQCQPGWALPDPVGFPLTDAWIDDTGAMVLSTHHSDLPLTLVTAIRPESGAVVWQRALGIEPDVHLKSIGPNLIFADARGAIGTLPLLDDMPPSANGWRTGGKELARSIPSLIREPFVDVRGEAMTVVGPTANGIVIRRVNSDLSIKDQKVELPAPLAGRPGFGPDALILPLRSGQLYRLSLTEPGARPVPGPTWRAPGVPADVEGAVVHWHGSEYLVSDGSRRLLRLSWSSAADYELGTATALERTRRLIHQPSVLPGSLPRVAVADAGGTLLLLRGQQFDVERFWRLGDDHRAITHGPTTSGNRLAVIVNQNELVCLDPNSPKPLWSHFASPDGWVGLPVALDEGWVVADRNGTITMLDPQTGQPRKPGLLLPGLVAVAGPMIALGPDRIMAVLTDGSARVVTAEQLLK